MRDTHIRPTDVHLAYDLGLQGTAKILRNRKRADQLGEFPLLSVHGTEHCTRRLSDSTTIPIRT